MAPRSPHGIARADGRPEPLGILYDVAVKRGICGAQRKNEAKPCEGARDEKGRSACGRHCGSKNRQGYPCSQHPRPRTGRCNNHGEKSPVGAESATFKDGSTSKFAAIFTGDALEHYEAARRDDRYLVLREDLAVLDTLFIEALKAARVGEGRALWSDLADQWRRLQAPLAELTKDATASGSEARQALRRMGEIITEGAGREAAEERALDIHERKRKTSETERKRIVDQERTVTQVQAMSLVAGMVALMREAVAGEENEREILARFHAGAARLVREYVGGSAGGLPAP